MEPTITIPTALAENVVAHLHDVLSTDEAYIIFNTNETHAAATRSTLALFRLLLDNQ